MFRVSLRCGGPRFQLQSASCTAPIPSLDRAFTEKLELDSGQPSMRNVNPKTSATGLLTDGFLATASPRTKTLNPKPFSIQNPNIRFNHNRQIHRVPLSLSASSSPMVASIAMRPCFSSTERLPGSGFQTSGSTVKCTNTNNVSDESHTIKLTVK